MKCNEWQNYMMKYFDRDINDIEEMRLRQHLRICKDCSEEFNSLKEIFSDIESEPAVEPPVNFEHQVMARIEKEADIYQKSGSDGMFVYNILLMASTFIFVILFGGILLESFSEPISLLLNFKHLTEMGREFLSSAVTMVKGICIAAMGVTASVYKTYYYAYILLGVLFLAIQGIFFKMVRTENGGANEKVS